MTTIHWRGDAAAVAQQTRVTPANAEVGDSFMLTIGNKSVSYTAAAATVADVTAGLAAAWNNSTAAELTEVTATDDTTHITLTADTPGVPFAVSASAVDGGGADTQTLTVTEIAASAGPRHWDTAANWSTGAVPANGDDVYLAHSEVSIRYGLDQSAVTLDSLHIAASFSGEIGLPRTNTSGASAYVEYRQRYLAVGCSDLRIGHGSGEGSGRMLLDTGSALTAIVVERTGSPAEDDGPALRWKGTHASNSLLVRAGSVGVALDGGEAATVLGLAQPGGRVEIGRGVTLGAVSLGGGGRLTIGSAASTVTQTGGTLTVLGSAALGTLELSGGVLDYRSTGTITELNLTGEAALADFSHDGQSRTVVDCTLSRGEIIDPLRTVSYTNGIQPGGRVAGSEAA